ncbi:MAG: hypothetical protein Q7P63_10045 [Verrucomicrobiota bacterium JB022]|nr:hypothetical protein [Verrucomicrobiota bacterium JB022]
MNLRWCLLCSFLLATTAWSQQPRPKLADPDASHGPLKEKEATTAPAIVGPMPPEPSGKVAVTLLPEWRREPTWLRNMKQADIVYDPDRSMLDNLLNPTYAFPLYQQSTREDQPWPRK